VSSLRQTTVPNIYTLPVSEQLDRVRALAEFLDHEWEMLVRSFEMLVPAATDKALIARFNQANSSWGFNLVRMQLIERCVLSISKLLLDGDVTNPSLRTLVRPFLPGNRDRYAELLKILRSDYSDWHKRISPEERQGRPAWEIAALEAMGEKDAQQAREEFDQRAAAVAADWPKLIEASSLIEPVRNQWVAHRELEYDPDTKKYKTVDLPSVNAMYKTIEGIVPKITDSVMHLLGLFRNLSLNPEEVQKFAKRDAADFWQLTGPLGQTDGPLR